MTVTLPQAKQNQLKQIAKHRPALYHLAQARLALLEQAVEAQQVDPGDVDDIARQIVTEAMIDMAGWPKTVAKVGRILRIDSFDLSLEDEAQVNDPHGLEALVVERAEVKKLAPGIKPLYDLVIAIERAGFGELTQLSVSKVTWAMLPGYTQADLSDLDLRMGDKIIDNYLVDNNLKPASDRAVEVKPREVVYRYVRG